MQSPKDIVKQAVEKDEHPKDVLDNLPVISEPRCNICKSEFRPLIDRMVVGPYTYASIARQFRGKDQYLNGSLDAVRKSVERHAKSHVTVRDQAIREIIEQRATEAGILVDDAKGSLATTMGLLELYVQKGYDQTTKPDSWVRHQDILEAVKIIEQMRKDTVSEQLEVWKKQVWAISQAVRDIVPPDLHPALVERAQELFEQPILELEATK
jgi:hypothetical protein